VDYLLRQRQRNRGPVCPQCRKKPLRYQDSRRLWRCAGCGEQMTILWGTPEERLETRVIVKSHGP